MAAGQRQRIVHKLEPILATVIVEETVRGANVRVDDARGATQAAAPCELQLSELSLIHI